MAKRYLNSEEKTDILRLITFHVNLQIMVDKWVKLNKDKESVKYLKMARSLMEKVTDIVVSPLDELEKQKIVDFAQKLDVIVTYKAEAKKEMERMLKFDDTLPVCSEDLYDIMEVCGEYCRLLCTNEGECKARDIMIRLDVPVANECAEKGVCPYKL